MCAYTDSDKKRDSISLLTASFNSIREIKSDRKRFEAFREWRMLIGKMITSFPMPENDPKQSKFVAG